MLSPMPVLHIFRGSTPVSHLSRSVKGPVPLENSAVSPPVLCRGPGWPFKMDGRRVNADASRGVGGDVGSRRGAREFSSLTRGVVVVGEVEPERTGVDGPSA